MPQVFPTLVTFEAGSPEQEDEEVRSEDNTNATKGQKEVIEKREKSPAVLLSEEELKDLLKKKAEEAGEGEEEDDDMALATTEGEVTSNYEKKPGGSLEAEKKIPYKEGKSVDTEEEEDKVEEKKEKPANKLTEQDGQVGLLEETESSTESEPSADLYFAAANGEIPVQVESEDLNPLTENQKSPSEKDLQETKKEEVGEKELLIQDMQPPETGDRERVADQKEDSSTKSKEKHPGRQDPEATMDHGQELKSSAGLKSGSQRSEEEEEKGKNDRGAFTKRQTRKQKKIKRPRKHSPQRNETHPVQDHDQLDHQEFEGSSTQNIVQQPQRKRTRKWGPIVGVNPVQIRAAVVLYPRSRSSFSGDLHLSGTPADPCEHFRCKRGKTCKLDGDGKPGCVCQEPLECPPSMTEFEHVCGTDNKTYDTSCKLFAAKCNLEGTKRGHKLHLDYLGPCKLIPKCMKNELVQFPLRMRDWLKNVLLQLYEHDSTSPGFLTPKQRFRVKKIFENERLLHAGNHSVELLVQDFEKNYNMYIYPVHWEFAQLDQHPTDRILSHSELAPLRVPLVPMEHCIPLFFQECDADKDKQITFKEWTSCFGIKDEDMDVNLLF
ncbi:hypothetical protein ILYODFUR_004312 [Ilyodon furcidens]|uniref:SPARC-like protein 1 n=2 Tax=Goodeidae TaxID=28758 RepID=A0ABV0T6G6_9TELE